MKKYIFTLILCYTALTNATLIEEKASFWNTQRRGANVFNEVIDNELLISARKNNIEFIRLAPDKFITKNRDFLIGDADEYKFISKEDLDKLIHVLDLCSENNIKVSLVFLSLPGSRWIQKNNNKDDLRLWTEDRYVEQSVKFWTDVVKNLKDHPAIVAYNILNEPHPERIYDQSSSDISLLKIDEISDKINKFYEIIVKNIREFDQSTPIIIESTAYADPRAFNKLKPINDSSIIYSFHMYEPFAYTNKKLNNDQFSYPGIITDPDTKQDEHWNYEKLSSFFQPIIEWQEKYSVPNQRILVGEFGGHRTTKGLYNYFYDLLKIFNNNRWHWAVYSFREDTWHGMDYALGQNKIPWKYWEALEKGEKFELPRYPNNKIYKLLVDSWNRSYF